MTDSIPLAWPPEEDRLKFMLSRAEAINRYSGLEQAMAACFAYFSGTENRIAGTIFFKISNARARRDILDEMKHEKIGIKYSGFWDSLLKAIAPLDERRNLVVHWTMAHNIYQTAEGELLFARVMLKKPNFYAWAGDDEELYSDDLDRFSQRCAVLAEALYSFLRVITNSHQNQREADTWREICQRPLDDPLPPDHPLYRLSKAP